MRKDVPYRIRSGRISIHDVIQSEERCRKLHHAYIGESESGGDSPHHRDAKTFCRCHYRSDQSEYADKNRILSGIRDR